MDEKIDFRMIVISDRKLCAPRLVPLVLKQAAQAGVKALQLREKDLSPRELHRLADDVQQQVARYGTKLLVNDRADIAAAVGAAGVHLTERSMPVGAARRILGDSALIGVSAHSVEGALAAEGEGADFVLFGPVFHTASHPDAAPVGPRALGHVVSRVGIPVFALGGIAPENAAVCIACGAAGVAVRAAVMGAKSARSVLRAFKKALDGL